MKVLELLDEIEEIIETSSGFPLTGKIMVDGDELKEIVSDIRASLPDEIQQAQWIKKERDRILDEAKTEYETILRDAQRQAEEMTDENVIMNQARQRAEDLMRTTDENSRQLKMSTYDYVDGILFDFQEKIDSLRDKYLDSMFEELDNALTGVNQTLAMNRDEIKEMAYRTTMNLDIPVRTESIDDQPAGPQERQAGQTGGEASGKPQER